MGAWRWLLGALLLAGGCDGSRTLVVDLRTDWVPGREVAGIRAAVDDEVIDERDVAPGEPLADGIRLGEREGIAPGAHDVTVVLRDPDGGTLASRRVRVTVDGSTAVTVVISRDCQGVTCDDPAAPECLGGRCVSPECTPENPDACPDDGCRSDAECDAPVSCVSAQCVSGACLFVPADGACDDGELCDPELDCRPEAEPTLLEGAGSIDAGFSHTCAIASDGSTSPAPFCWGDNVEGGVGQSPFGSFGAARVAMFDSFEIAAGRHFGCLTEVGSQVICWGDNSRGAVGRGTDDVGRGETRAVITPGAVTRPLLAGTSHACVGSGDGDFTCWGRNDLGQAQYDVLEDPILPTALPTGIRPMALGEVHTCGVDTTTGEAVCWGGNANGELGDGTRDDRRRPTPVTGLTGVTAMAATSSHNAATNGATCAIDGDAAVWCWGHNSEGKLGDGTTTTSDVPVRVMGLPRADAIWAGARSFCARDGAETYCWGQNLSGELGLGTTSSFETTAQRAPMLDQFSAIALGHGFGCGVDGGRVYCWGANDLGQCNGRPGDPVDALVPVAVPLAE